jgi:hypothetical protein
LKVLEFLFHFLIILSAHEFACQHHQLKQRDEEIKQIFSLHVLMKTHSKLYQLSESYYNNYYIQSEICAPTVCMCFEILNIRSVICPYHTIWLNLISHLYAVPLYLIYLRCTLKLNSTISSIFFGGNWKSCITWCFCHFRFFVLN